MKLTDKMRKDYLKMFNFLFLDDKSLYPTLDMIVKAIVAEQDRYKAVQVETGCPWWFIGIIHRMEANSRFDRHLHNGDPLTGYTVNQPIGRPKDGVPPFTWEQSAIDALSGRRIEITQYSTPDLILFELEKYNGFGYRRVGINSPYLWGKTNHHSSGKFVADGKFDINAKTSQIGAAAILRRLSELEIYCPTETPEVPVISYDPITSLREVEQLQIFLNKVSPLKLRVDGVAGSRTNRSFFHVFRIPLPGAPEDAT